MKKICVVTGTRAEYGLLKPLMEKLIEEDGIILQTVVTGMHLSPEFGLTYREIENDGFGINDRIEILLSSDTPIGVSNSMGLAMIGFSQCFARLQPDYIVILGDRYEIMAATTAASIARIPIIHLYGGETTEGAFDEAFRHSITKMSFLHFTSTEDYRQRVIQLGEHPERVFNVGAIGIENVKKMKLMEKEEIEKNIKFKFGKKTALVTFHPVTLEQGTSEKQFKNILDALHHITDLKVVFTKANSDTDGRIINKMIDEYVKNNEEKAISFTSMGQLRYLSTMKYVDVVVGNSSSGIVEAPSFHVPTVNIGDRQKGRIQAETVINCEPKTVDIINSLYLSFSTEFKEKIKNTVNPYGEGNVTTKIIAQIKKLMNSSIDLKKVFYDIK